MKVGEILIWADKHWLVLFSSFTLVNWHGWPENGPWMKIYFLNMGDIPASYVSLPEGCSKWTEIHPFQANMENPNTGHILSRNHRIPKPLTFGYPCAFSGVWCLHHAKPPFRVRTWKGLLDLVKWCSCRGGTPKKHVSASPLSLAVATNRIFSYKPHLSCHDWKFYMPPPTVLCKRRHQISIFGAILFQNDLSFPSP